MSALVPAYRALLSVAVDRQAVHRASVHPPFVLTSDNTMAILSRGSTRNRTQYIDALDLRLHVLAGTGHLSPETTVSAVMSAR
jgi:hypothetical protein